VKTYNKCELKQFSLLAQLMMSMSAAPVVLEFERTN